MGSGYIIGARTGTCFFMYFGVCLWFVSSPFQLIMASQQNLEGDIPEVDFSSTYFRAHREPLKDLINTFSDLYIDSDEDDRVSVEEPDDDS